MNEREYINATNLAKVRAARNVFREFLPVNMVEEVEADIVLQALERLENRLASVVKTEETEQERE